MDNIIKDVKCTKLDHFGRGISKIDNHVVFIHNMLPKESGDIKIIKKNNKYMEAVVTDLISKTMSRVTPICEYYDKCGGCQLLHMSSELQKEFKYTKVKDILSRFANYNGKINDLLTGTNYNYRNKVTLHVKNKKIGFYQSLSNDLVPINSCELLDDKLNVVLYDLKKYFANHYSEVTEIVLRKVDDRVMISFDGDLPLKELDFSTPVSVFMNEKFVMGDAENYIVLEGLKFRISPNSFFQVNNEMVSVLYNKVMEKVKELKPNKLLDLYCGTGTIGLIASKHAKEVVGVELSSSAIKDANYNKDKNNIKNITFIEGKAEDNIEQFKDTDLLVVDPPRAGIMRKGIDDILKIKPKNVIYVSCDPVTLARDISLLSEEYKITEVTPIDMFPNTYHVESVCVLKLR